MEKRPAWPFFFPRLLALFLEFLRMLLPLAAAERQERSD
jgi:hypothetical protein